MVEVINGLLLLGTGMFIYFLPAIVAGFRNHHHTAGIIILNFFLGWTLIGWVAAMVWSVTNAPQIRNNRDPRWNDLRA